MINFQSGSLTDKTKMIYHLKKHNMILDKILLFDNTFNLNLERAKYVIDANTLRPIYIRSGHEVIVCSYNDDDSQALVVSGNAKFWIDSNCLIKSNCV